MIRNHRKNLGKILKEQRRSIPLTLQQLSDASGVSVSHLGRIENEERFPSAIILQRIASPLGYEEKELFTLAGYLSASGTRIGERKARYGGRNVDPDVIRALGKEPVEVQRAVIGILNIFKNISASISRKQSDSE